MRQFVLLALVAGCKSDEPVDTDTAPLVEGDYADMANWVCHPDLADDVCRGDFTVSAVAADGSVSELAHTVAESPGVDCFYVYPTVSSDTALNADRNDGGEESFTVQVQAGRYSELCTVYAPLYRQVSLRGLLDPSADYELAYGDVVEAFDAYLAVSDAPFLLLGHSQGTGHLARLIAERVETDPALADRLVTAHLLGGRIEVPTGADVGGTFASTPLCRAADETGCVVHYVSYASDDALGDTTVFGVSTPDTEVACVNPAALAGGSTVLNGAYPHQPGAEIIGIAADPYDDPADDAIATPYFDWPGLVSGECTTRNGVSFLEITVTPDDTDPRTDRIGGTVLPGWGLHVIDVNLAHRDLVALAATQIQAHTP